MPKADILYSAARAGSQVGNNVTTCEIRVYEPSRLDYLTCGRTGICSLRQTVRQRSCSLLSLSVRQPNVSGDTYGDEDKAVGFPRLTALLFEQRENARQRLSHMEQFATLQ